MSKFNAILNKLLKEHNAQPITCMYQQFHIAENKGFYYVYENNKIIGSGKSLESVKELCDTICSGC
jgi:hypothetical protein